jgi:hypothetical protein
MTAVATKRSLATMAALLVAPALGIAGAGAAAAASSPTVTTGSAGSIRPTSAQLHGTVNPNGGSTTYYFQWGLTTGYGDQHPASRAGSGTSAKAVTQTASHLVPGTIYHYRLVATNQFGTTVGADRKFRTAGAPPPGVTTGPATNLNPHGADLTGTVNPSGRTTTWFFQYGLTTAYTAQTVAHTVSGSTPATGVDGSLQGLLAPGTIYHYRLVARHGGSAPSTSFGGDATFMTYPSPRPQSTVTARTRPRHSRRRPFVFTTSGHLFGPTSIPAQYACQGDVTIRFFRGVRQVGFNLAPVQPTCVFSAQTRFVRFRRHAGHRVHLRVVIRYISTPYLGTNRAPYEHITAG